MKVSVIIATHNRREILRRCLLEYSKQTHPDVEIIVADNGSTDDTLSVLPLEFPHVRFLAMGQEMGPRALNHAAQVATGDVLWRTDDDAFPASDNTLADATEFLNINTSVVALTGDIIEATIGYQKLDYYPFSRPDPIPSTGLPINEFCGTASMIRRTQFLEAGGFWDKFYLEELDLSARLIAKGGEIRYTPWIEVVHLSAFSGERNIRERWLLQSTQTIRYQWRYFSWLRALYRSAVALASLTLSAAYHRFSPLWYWNGLRNMLSAARNAWRSERVAMTRDQLKRVTMGRSIWDQMFRYYAVRWRSRTTR